MTYDLITHEKFEEARGAFIVAWEKSDAEGGGRIGGGSRSTAGLTAALQVLNIKEDAA